MNLDKQIEEQEEVLRRLRKQRDAEQDRVRDKITEQLLDFIKAEYDVDISKDTDSVGTALHTLSYYLSHIIVCQEGRKHVRV